MATYYTVRLNRRALLEAAAAVSGGVIAGCVAADSSATEYEECPLSVIYADDLPEDVAREVETAVEDGSYETDGDLTLSEVMGPDTDYISVDGRYLEPAIESDSETTTLTFEETIPSHDRDRRLSLSNRSGEDVDVTISVEYSPYSDELAEEPLLDDEFELGAGGSEPLSDDFLRYGRYDAEVEFEPTCEVREESWNVNLRSTFLGLAIEDESRPFLDMEQSDIDPCSWGQNGRFG